MEIKVTGNQPDDIAFVDPETGRRLDASERGRMRRKIEQQRKSAVARAIEKRGATTENPWREMLERVPCNYGPGHERYKQIQRWRQKAEEWDREHAAVMAEQERKRALAENPDVQRCLAQSKEWLAGARTDEERERFAYAVALAEDGQVEEAWQIIGEAANEKAEQLQKRAYELDSAAGDIQIERDRVRAEAAQARVTMAEAQLGEFDASGE